MNTDMKLLLSSNLRKLLKEHDITVAQLSRATKVPQQTINNWLSGLDPRNMSQVKTVALYFDLSLDELAYGDKPRKLSKEPIEEFKDEINAGVFEVILRKVRSGK